MTRIYLSTALLLAACSSSHGSDGCADPRPDCYPPSSTPGCCLDSPSPAVCVDALWSCGIAGSLASGCGRIDATCMGPPPPPVDGGSVISYDACSIPSECTLATNTCCGTCGRPTLSDFDAVNQSRSSDHYLDVACPEARTGAVLCPDCPVASNPNLLASCGIGPMGGGTCYGVDVESDALLSSCTADTDCRLRVPDCCPCGADTSSYNLIAIRVDRGAEFGFLVCDPGQACAECEPAYPTDVVAACVDSFCRVVPAP